MKTEHRIIWIDLDNSPHVPLFCPIIEALQDLGFELVVTARDAFQVTGLAELYGLKCHVVGKHSGKNPVKKIAGLLVRSLKLLPYIAKHRPVLAVSHGSRAQMLVAKLLRIETVVMVDYEHVTFLSKPEWVFVPAVVSEESARKFGRNIFQYPGIKEDVYVHDSSRREPVRLNLGIADDEILVAIRPPATEAHYHNVQAEGLFEAVMQKVTGTTNTTSVVLPRSTAQRQQVERRWRNEISDGRVLIPDRPVDGSSLIAESDLVISGGGTMNREAAALQVPVYSIFRGSVGSVDQYLASKRRLVLLTSSQDIDRLLRIEKREHAKNDDTEEPAVLPAIVDKIVSLVPLD